MAPPFVDSEPAGQHTRPAEQQPVRGQRAPPVVYQSKSDESQKNESSSDAGLKPRCTVRQVQDSLGHGKSPVRVEVVSTDVDAADSGNAEDFKLRAKIRLHIDESSNEPEPEPAIVACVDKASQTRAELIQTRSREAQTAHVACASSGAQTESCQTQHTFTQTPAAQAEPARCVYRIAVSTAESSGESSAADVHAVLHGSDGVCSGRLPLQNCVSGHSESYFAPGRRSAFDVEGSDVGKVQAVTLCCHQGVHTLLLSKSHLCKFPRSEGRLAHGRCVRTLVACLSGTVTLSALLGVRIGLLQSRVRARNDHMPALHRGQVAMAGQACNGEAHK